MLSWNRCCTFCVLCVVNKSKLTYKNRVHILCWASDRASVCMCVCVVVFILSLNKLNNNSIVPTTFARHRKLIKINGFDVVQRIIKWTSIIRRLAMILRIRIKNLLHAHNWSNAKKHKTAKTSTKISGEQNAECSKFGNDRKKHTRK